MIFIRIDDYNKENHRVVLGLIEKAVSIIPSIKIMLGVIISEVNDDLLIDLFNRFDRNIIIAFHWYFHKRDEFLKGKDFQKESFLEAEKFFSKIGYGKRYFFPPYNNFDGVTIKLLMENKYDNFSLNYKDFLDNRHLLENKFKIYETNVFFNKKDVYWNWYIDDFSEMERDINNLLKMDIDIWVEIHPQYIRTEEDVKKYVYLLNLLEIKLYRLK